MSRGPVIKEMPSGHMLQGCVFNGVRLNDPQPQESDFITALLIVTEMSQETASVSARDGEGGPRAVHETGHVAATSHTRSHLYRY